ncbi:MAG: Rid family hydrolase [Geminicoccaceae bacterium]
MAIERVPGQARGRCRAVSYNGLVYAVSTDTSGAATLAEQARRTLEALEQNLCDAGSGESGLLQVTVYLRDMAGKPEMDEVWCDWVGPAENWAQRACVGADLAGDDMIEIVATAARL